MFFKKTNQEFRDWLKEKFSKMEMSITGRNQQLDALNETIGQLQSVIQKHDMALEDLLDEWEERQSEEEEIRKQFREYEQNESRFLELFEMYQEQFWNLKRFASEKDESWAAQMILMEENLQRPLKLSGIDLICANHTAVDYDLHEVIETVETAESEKAGQIARVYRCGYLYKGKVIKKAQVAAYKECS